MAENEKNPSQAPGAASTDAAMAESGAEELQAQIDRLSADLQKAQEQTLRAQAELENFRRRMLREMEQERKFALLPLISDLLPALDNLDRALHSAAADQAGSPVVAGVQMVANELRSVLERHHCRPIEAHGQPFDPHYHEAIGQQPTAEHPPGAVTHVARSGWKLHDRVVRPAQVLVASEPPEASGG